MKYGKAALLMGIALLVPCQLCWADNASLNSAASNAPHAVQPENTADVSLNSSMGLNTGSSERTGASAADPEPNTPSTGESEGAGSDSRSSDSSHTTYAKGWNETEDGWVYLMSDNQDSFCEGWLKLGDTWYWFDPATHLMATGVVECNGCMYRFVDSGVREGAMTVGWSYDSEASLWYYARPSGVLECGWLEIGDIWYYFDEGTCAMQTGWLELDGAAYYFDESSGAMATGWHWLDGAWYSLRPTGVLERGWLLERDTWYWLDRETGAMANGPCEIDGTPYGFYSSGAMASGWFFFDGAWYYASDSGVLQSGWLADSGCRYYFDGETYAMQTGWIELDGIEYYFDDASGAMASNRWVVDGDGQAFYVGSSGAILCKGVQSADGIIVTGEDGLPFAGWIELNGNRFLFSDEGLMLTGWQELDDTWYYLNDQGIMQTGWLYWDGHWYLLGNSGAMQTGWSYVDGNWYYFNSWGYMVCGGWQYVGSVDYKFSSSGAMVGAWVDVPCYMQYPELPTGCESVALTNLLNYYGFGLSKTTIAGHYLPLSWSNNFVTAFAGDPFTGTGGLNGCVAPAIVIAGNNYLSAAGSSLCAVDVSFSSIPALKSRLSCGQPIEVWNTEWGGYPGGRYAASWYNGHSYGLWGGNHAVVLKGYDDEKGIVYVSDSISGDVTRDAKVFFSTWQMMDSQAVAIE